MAHDEPPHEDLRCLQIQLFSSLVVKELTHFFQLEGTKTLVLSDWMPGGISNSYTMVCLPVGGDNPRAFASGLSPIRQANDRLFSVQAGKSGISHFIPPSPV